jgi:hypothetical protein
MWCSGNTLGLYSEGNGVKSWPRTVYPDRDLSYALIVEQSYFISSIFNDALSVTQNMQRRIKVW